MGSVRISRKREEGKRGIVMGRQERPALAAPPPSERRSGADGNGNRRGRKGKEDGGKGEG